MGQQLTGGVPLSANLANGAARESLPPSADNIRRWSSWTTLAVDRLPVPYYLLVVIAGLWLAAEQAFEYACESGSLQNLAGCLNGAPAGVPAENIIKFAVLPVLTVYMLMMLKVLKGTAVRSLAELRPAVQIGDADYDGFVHRMVNTNRRVELALLLTSVTGVVLVFVLLDIPLAVTTNSHAREFGLGALFILSAYVVFGWTFLTLVFSALQLGNALGRLAYRPLSVNIYDPGSLLPFGHIALIYSLSVAGVILILLIGLGQPTQISSWIIIVLLSVASLVALVIPLWGVNRQMRQARHAELGRIYAQFKSIHETVLANEKMDANDLAELANRTSTLVNLRKVVLETPTWPYRDTLTIIRTVAIAIAPVIYFMLTLLISSLISAR